MDNGTFRHRFDKSCTKKFELSILCTISIRDLMEANVILTFLIAMRIYLLDMKYFGTGT